MIKQLVTALFITILPLNAPAENLKIGVMLDLSGEYAASGQAFLEGIMLATEEVNKAGGVAGSPIELLVEDTRYNMAQVQSAARKLLSIDKVKAALIMTYTEVKVAGPTFEAARVPLINLWDSAPQIEDLGSYVFGIGPWTPSAGEAAAEFASHPLHGRTAAIINTNGEWSLDVSRIFARSFEQQGGRIVQEISLNPSDTNLKSAVLKLKSLKPDVIYAPFADNISTLFKQLVMMKFGVPIITSDVLTEDVLQALGDSAEGIYHTQIGDPAHEATARMLDLYRLRFGRPCQKTSLTAWGYDSIRLLAEAAASTGPASEQLRDGLYKIKDFPGASGPISISPEGSSRVMEEVFQVRGGRLKSVR